MQVVHLKGLWVDIRPLPDVLFHRLVSRLLGLSSLVVELGLAVDGGTAHGDGHTAAIEEINVDVEEEDTEKYGETLLEIAANSHGKGTGDLVGVEGGDVEEEGEETVTSKDEDGAADVDFWGRHLGSESGDFTGRGGAGEGLKGGERRHAHEELHGRKGEGARHESVGDDGL